MLLVMFRSGESLYGVDARRVVEVVPRVSPRPIPHAPPELLGLLSYRGGVVPLIDFGVLTGGSTGSAALSTRAIIARITGCGGVERLVGLVAEDVSRVRKVEPGSAVAASMNLGVAPYLGAIFRTDEGLVQLVEVDKLLPEGFASSLYGVVATESG